MKVSSIITATIVAAGLLGMGLSIRSGLRTFNWGSQRTVDVRGLATREVKANKVTWPIVFKETGDDLPTVYASVTSTNATIVKFLKDNGIKETEISISAPQVNNLRADRYNTLPLPYNYSVQSVVTVSSSQVDKVRELINRQGELLSQGIAILTGDYSNQTVYEYTELNSIKPEMIAEATKNAREAANKFADDSQSELGKIKSARQGQFTIEDRDNYTPYIKEVRVVTSLTYFLED
ncbi:MAG: SIMPL domain-containing protein [Paramuribaculum sp.]|nr:SIMPL domain-containing protein [Paramuribaculum sp.]